VDKESRLYLVMMTCFSFSQALSGMFINVFLWKLNSSFTLLAMYSLIYSLVVVASFPLCAMLARRRSPMSSLRLGILCFAVTYALVLFLQEQAAHHIWEIGFGIGLGSSFFAIGMHMQMLDSTQNSGRDRFLYIGNLLSSFSGLLAPLLSGWLIHNYTGMAGYYFVFSLSLIWFVISALISLKLKGKRVSKHSHLLAVWKKPSREWRGMYWITMGSGFVEGTYYTFLITMMGYVILKNELSLGGFATFGAVIGLLTSLVLAKVSKPSNRLNVYSIGSLLLCASSIWVAVQPSFLTLVVHSILGTIGQNLINTTFNSWTYASIEKDPDYEERRLDYVVIREIPLGVGRTAGIFFFLALQAYVAGGQILYVSFACFGTVFLLMIPALRRIWAEERGSLPPTANVKKHLAQ
jgi:MFS transporter, YQGE family, putative transporter